MQRLEGHRWPGGGVSEEINKLVGIKGLITGGVKQLVGRFIVTIVITVVDVVVDGHVILPFDDKAALLDERLTLLFCQRFNAGNSGIGDRNESPLVPGNFCTGGKGHEIVIAFGIAGV